MCKCWFRALHLFLYSLAVYSPLSDSSDAALSPLVYRAPSRVCAYRAGKLKPYTYRRAAALSVSVRHSHGHRARSLGLSLARAGRAGAARGRVRVACGPLCGSVALRVCGCMCVCGDETEMIKVAVLAREV